MIHTRHHHTITITVTDKIEFTAREADFLRKMAKHCVSTRMPGSHACELLIGVLDAAGVPTRPEEPVYGIFEEPGQTPNWIKP